MGHQIILTLPGTLSIKIIVYFGLKTETGKIGQAFDDKQSYNYVSAIRLYPRWTV
jgi:hypothetical protein